MGGGGVAQDAQRLHGIPQQPRGDTGDGDGGMRRNANRKHMSASEKGPISQEGRIPGGGRGGARGGKLSSRACTRMHTQRPL